MPTGWQVVGSAEPQCVEHAPVFYMVDSPCMNGEMIPENNDVLLKLAARPPIQ